MTPVTLPPMMPRSPEERGKDPLRQTNGPSRGRTLLNVTAEKQHDSQLQIDYIINQHGREHTQTHAMISYLTMVVHMAAMVR